MGKTELIGQDKEDLIDLCIVKLGGKILSYKKSKKDLVALLQNMVRWYLFAHEEYFLTSQ